MGIRIFRELSPDEQRRLNDARAETEAARDEILAQGRAHKQALEAARDEARRTGDPTSDERTR